MTKKCNICNQDFDPKYDWQQNCYPCFKKGLVPKSQKAQAEDKTLEAMRKIYELVAENQAILNSINLKISQKDSGTIIYPDKELPKTSKTDERPKSWVELDKDADCELKDIPVVENNDR